MTARSSSSGLAGIDRTAWPAPGPSYNVAGTGSYGYTESVDGSGDGPHHRLGGRLAAGVTPKWTPWLSAALIFDGRLDIHPDDGMGSHVTGVGDPRLLLRGGHALTDEWQLGGDATLWVPGETAPSVDFSAVTTDFRMLATYDPRGRPWSLLGAAGYRLDYSARAALPLNRLRGGDRLVVGLSDFDAVLVAIGASYDLPSDTQLLAELSTDLLIGSGAPPIMQSPWRVSVGARHPLAKDLTGEVLATISLSQRGSITPNDPLVPMEPRFSLSVGLRFGRSLLPPPVAEEAPDPEPEHTTKVVEPPPQVLASTLSGQLLDAQGQPLPDAMVKLVSGEGEPREVLTDAEGRYQFDEVPLGTAALNVDTVGFAAQEWTVEVGAEPVTAPPRTLVESKPEGTLRGLTRSFNSEPVKAQIVITGHRGRTAARIVADEDGHFEQTLPPGKYRVRIRARGYSAQRRNIQIYDKSVTVLNVDLREHK